MAETQFLSTESSQSSQELIYSKTEIKIWLYAEVNDNRDRQRMPWQQRGRVGEGWSCQGKPHREAFVGSLSTLTVGGW